MTPFAAALVGCGDAGSPSGGGSDTATLDAGIDDLGTPPPLDTAEPLDTAAPPDTAPPPVDTATPVDTGPAPCPGAVCLDLTDAKNAALAAVQGSAMITLGSDKVIVVHVSDGVFVATSAVCTHKGCKVTFQKNDENLLCPCHGSVFELDGSVTKGPATKALKVYTTAIVGDLLVIDPD